MPNHLRDIVSRMVAAGEDEANIAAVIQRFNETHQTAPTVAQSEPRSVSGFLGNVAESGGRFLGDVAAPFMRPIQTTKGLAAVAMNPRQTIGAIGEGLKQRYGSPGAIGTTLYKDPVGAAADVSSLLLGGGGMLRTAGLVGKAPGVARAGRLLTRASDVTNPLRAVTMPTRAIGRELGIGAVRSTVRPPKALREDFGGSREIAKTIVDEGIVSEGGATKLLSASRARADDLLAAAERTGTPGVPTERLAAALRGKPTVTAGKRSRLGIPGGTEALSARATAIRAGGRGDIPLIYAQTLKREAQDLAFEAGKQNLSLDKQANEAIARALRTGIERRVPDVAPINARTQRLLGAQQAVSEATDRPRALTNLAAGGAGGLGFLASGNPVGAVLLGAGVRALDSPYAGMGMAKVLSRTGRTIDAKALVRALLLARLAQNQPVEDEGGRNEPR